jgi:hypothetical protein
MGNKYDIIRFLSILAPSFGIIIFFTRRNFSVKSTNYLVAFMIVCLGVDVLSYVLGSQKRSTIELANVYFMVQLIFVGLIYNQILSGRTRMISVIVLIGELLMIVNAVAVQPFSTFQNIGWSLSIVVIMLLSSTHFFELMRSPVPLVQSHPPFWITVGIFFYCSLGFIAFTLSKHFAEQFSVENFRSIWIFHNANNIFKNLCFAAAIWWSAKNNVSKVATV